MHNRAAIAQQNTCVRRPPYNIIIFVSTMANRASNLDPLVFSIQDLEKEGTKRLPKQYRDFYNGGAMDMITFVTNLSTWQSLM